MKANLVGDGHAQPFRKHPVHALALTHYEQATSGAGHGAGGAHFASRRLLHLFDGVGERLVLIAPSCAHNRVVVRVSHRFGVARRRVTHGHVVLRLAEVSLEITTI